MKIVDASGNKLPSTQPEEPELSPSERMFAEIFMNKPMFDRGLRKAQDTATEVAIMLGLPEDEAAAAVSNPDHPLQAKIVDPLMGLIAEILELSFNEMIQHAEFADRAEAFKRDFKVVSALPDAAGNGIPVFTVGRGKPWKR